MTKNTVKAQETRKWGGMQGTIPCPWKGDESFKAKQYTHIVFAKQNSLKLKEHFRINDAILQHESLISNV